MKKQDSSIEFLEFRNVNELVEGYDAAMVNYALSDKGKMVRIVTFFNTQDVDMENISAAHDFYCKDICRYIISKNFLYTIKSFSNIKKSCIDFWFMLWKKIDGFTPPKCTYDCTTNKYMNL